MYCIMHNGDLMERLDKFIAGQTGRTRSQARQLISKGGVSVNGAVVRSSDAKIDPDNDIIRIGTKQVMYEKYIYYMMNKPAGVLSASRDPKARTVIDLLAQEDRRTGLFPAGRLDIDTTGMLIITDDGDFAHRLLSPSKGVYKTYIATLDNPVGEQEAAIFSGGMVIDKGEICLPAELVPLENRRAQVRICQGKFHQVKRMFAAVGREVLALERRAIGTLELDPQLEPGGYRRLQGHELDMLFKNLN